MAYRYIPSTTTAVEFSAHDLDYRDEEIMQGLVTAGALVALADGEVTPVERAELMNFVERQGFVPSIPLVDISETFDSRVQELEGRNCANVIMKTLRPLAGQSLASIVVGTAQRVAVADQKIHLGELQALRLLRRIMINLPEISTSVHVSPHNSAECRHCGAVLLSAAWSESATPPVNIADWHCMSCGRGIEKTKGRVEERLPNDLVQAFFPSLLV
jgi:tellurite resistance protein TerB